MEEYITIVSNVNFANYFHFKQDISGPATAIKFTDTLAIVGTESSVVFVFLIEDDYQQGYKAVGQPTQGSAVVEMDITVEQEWLAVCYASRHLRLYSLTGFHLLHELTMPHSFRSLSFVPIACPAQQLKFINRQRYSELVVLDDADTIVRYSFLLRHNRQLDCDVACVVRNAQVQETMLYAKEVESGEGTPPSPQVLAMQLTTKLHLILLALLYREQLLVLSISYGRYLQPEQQKIQLVLRFARPDAQIYRVIFARQEDPSGEGYLSWGTGQFKQTNKDNHILIANWGLNQFYAFKLMADATIVQGGHLYLNHHHALHNRMMQFISKNIFITYQDDSLMFLNTTQFEYGLPFTLNHIQLNYNQECRIAKLSSGQYKPTFKVFDQIQISQQLLDSINQGYQSCQCIKIKQQEARQYVHVRNNHIFILQGVKLLEIKLKHWREYLEQMKYTSWSQCIRDCSKILHYELNMLDDIHCNDQDRQKQLNPFIQELALQYLQQPEFDTPLLMDLLVASSNEQLLFDVCLQKMNQSIFYKHLCTLIEKGIKLSIPSNHLIDTLQQLYILDQNVVSKYVFHIHDIHDTKELAQFLMDHNMINEVIHVCSSSFDFITPYKYTLQLVSNDASQSHYLFEFLSNCLNGQQYNRNKLTEHQFHAMLTDLFTYLFDYQNLLMLIQMNYKETLSLLLFVFQERIKQVLIKSNRKIALDGRLHSTLMEDLIDVERTPKELLELSKVYILIKQAELEYLTSNVEKEDISVAFSCHVLAHCGLKYQRSHLLLNVCRYTTMLREEQDTIFDISWLLVGKVCKKVDAEIIKNEFLLRVAQQMDYAEEVYERLLVKAREERWVYLEAHLLSGLGRVDESLGVYLKASDESLRQRIFVDLQNMIRSKDKPCFQFLVGNIERLYEINAKSLFTLVYTYCKDYWPLIVNLKIEKTIRVELISYIRDRDSTLSQELQSVEECLKS